MEVWTREPVPRFNMAGTMVKEPSGWQAVATALQSPGHERDGERGVDRWVTAHGEPVT